MANTLREHYKDYNDNNEYREYIKYPKSLFFIGAQSTYVLYNADVWIFMMFHNLKMGSIFLVSRANKGLIWSYS